MNNFGFIGKKKIDKAKQADRLNLKEVAFMSDKELASLPAQDVFIFDVECYYNFFYVAFKHVKTGKIIAFEKSPDFEININKLNWLMWRFCLVGFNSINYDIPMLSLALKGVSTTDLKKASDSIIQENLKPWIFEKQFKIKIQKYNHIDLIEVAPLQGSLKLYGGRLHCPTMQDLPFDPERILTAHEAHITRIYCCNDLDNTELLFEELSPQLKLRAEMTKSYGVELRSKSDAQIAEAVINSELKKVLGYYPKKPKFSQSQILKFEKPDFINFQTPELKSILDKIIRTEFELDALGSPIMPKSIENLTVKLGETVYKLGIGGLHSQEKKVAHFATDDIILSDNDVESYYPRIILNQKLFPPHLGEAFLTVYEYIVNNRLDAKGKAKALKATDRIAAAGFKKIADSLKIVINGSFGKLGNKYSTLCAPQLMLQVTITGQLCLLMLIEMTEKAGYQVISANTDGIIIKYHKQHNEHVRNIIEQWEKITDFKTEETRYKAVLSRDVNSYIAIKESGGDAEARFLDEQLGVKTKGAFCERGSALNSVLSTNPQSLVCIDALLKFVKDKVPIEKTVKECKDIRRFVTIRNVKGGGEKNGVYLGKTVRFYYPKNEIGFIAYVGSGKKVAKTEGAKPLMDLPETLPNDIDYNYYINETKSMLYDCGYLKEVQTPSFF